MHCATVTSTTTRPLQCQHYSCPIRIAMFPMQQQALSHREARQARQATHAQASTSERTLQPQSEAYSTFTNTQGYILKEVAPDVWAADRPFLPRLLLKKVDVGGRMTIIRLKDGKLWVHAPLALDHNLQSVLKTLGEVGHIVTSNFEHMAFAEQWKKAYPAATSYGPPGFSDKVPQISPVELRDSAPAEWKGDIGMAYLGYERNPFTGKPFFHEIIFVHKPSGVLMTTDLWWNYPESVPGGTRAFKFGMDQIFRPFYNNLMIGDKGQFAQVMQRVFNDWQWDTIIPCHGEVVKGNGKQILRAHLKLGNTT